MKRLLGLLGLGVLLAPALFGATNVLVSGGILRDAAGNPLPNGALVVLVASTQDGTFATPAPGALLRPGDSLGSDDVVVATWAVDSAVTGVAGGAFRLVTFDYAQMGLPNFNAGDPLVLYWFPAATLVNPVAGPNSAYGSYRSDTPTSRSNLAWFAPLDTAGATLGLNVLTPDAGGDVPVASSQASRTIEPAPGSPLITAQPIGKTVAPGDPVVFTVVASGDGTLLYQWYKGSSPLAGATTATFALASAQLTDAGTYTVVVSNTAGTVTSLGAVLAVNAGGVPTRGVQNAVVRASAGTGAAILSGAFTVEATTGKLMLVRAIGPTLTTFNVAGVLADPRLEIVDAATGTLVASNDDWGTAANAAQVPTASSQVGAFALGSGSKDAVVLATFPPGTYRARVIGAGGATGLAQLEIYDADSTPRLVYLAVKGYAGTGTAALVQGFAVTTPPAGRSYLIRALGPSLGGMGFLADPTVTVFNGAGTQIAINDNWGGASALATVAASVGAQPIPVASREAVLNFVPPAAGGYTVQVAGVGGTSGLALLEIFEADAARAAQLAVALVVPPEPLTVAVGQPASFGVVAVGKPAPALQWRKDTVPISGATNAILVMPAVQAGDAGSYDVVAANPGGTVTSPAAVLTVNAFAQHDADTDRNFRLSLFELTRVIELFNTRNGTARTGSYQPQFGTEDGFASDPARLANAVVGLTRYHSADTNRDGRLSLFELTRVIELFNYRSGTSRTGQYHVQLGTEDGFAPGP